MTYWFLWLTCFCFNINPVVLNNSDRLSNIEKEYFYSKVQDRTQLGQFLGRWFYLDSNAFLSLDNMEPMILNSNVNHQVIFYQYRLL